MQLTFDPSSPESYRLFLKVKSLPTYRIRGRVAEFPDEYADRLGVQPSSGAHAAYKPKKGLFDYQAAIAETAIDRQRFAVFADPGLGKTFILAEFARHCLRVLPKSRRVLWVNPDMVTEQSRSELARFYNGDLMPEIVRAANLQEWLNGDGKRFGITNFEALKRGLKRGQLGALLVDESSVMKSHYGQWGRRLIDLGKGLNWKICATGTPAPNDRIEYGNHAVFLDQFPNTNAFLARYFINRGQTQDRWVLKPHALEPFYRSLSHWCIFLTNPATYGWKDNVGNIPPIHCNISEVEMTDEQRELVRGMYGQMFVTDPGGITKRGKLSTIAKGFIGKKRVVATRKYEAIAELVNSWPDESTLIWCSYDREQDALEATFPDAASLRGSTRREVRLEAIDAFKSGERKILVSKAKILGFGLNLQRATRQVFSTLKDSYEEYFQCVKRSNRVGSTRPLNVHIPVMDIERPMIETVLRKADRVQHDTETQERIFRKAMG